MMCFYRCFAGALAPVRESRAILAHHLQSRPLRTIDDCQSHWGSEQLYRSTARRTQSDLVICGRRWGIGNIHQTSILPQKLFADHKAQAPHRRADRAACGARHGPAQRGTSACAWPHVCTTYLSTGDSSSTTLAPQRDMYTPSMLLCLSAS